MILGALEVLRAILAANWDAEWLDNHIPTIDRLKKVDGHYTIEPCPHCEQLKRGK